MKKQYEIKITLRGEGEAEHEPLSVEELQSQFNMDGVWVSPGECEIIVDSIKVKESWWKGLNNQPWIKKLNRKERDDI